jgi:hypothetical protein
MPVRTRVDSIAGDISMLLGAASVSEQAKKVAEYARSEIAKIDTTNRRILGRIPPPTLTVDGSQNGSLEKVRPDGGLIVAQWDVVGEALAWISQTLRGRSPVVSGAYRDGHVLFADGVEIPFGAQAPLASQYLFFNPVPYSRRIEIGKTESGRDFEIHVPNRIYERTAEDAQARFGSGLSIRFAEQSPPNILSAKHASVAVPAITVTLQPV